MRVIGFRVDGVVRRHLDDVHVKYFQPMHEVVRHRGNKAYKEIVPIVSGLFFTYGLESEIQKCCNVCDNKLQFIFPRGHKITDRIVIGNKEMEDFIKVASQKGATFIAAEDINPAVGKRVKIHGGTFDGVEGKLISKGRGKTLVVEIGVMAVKAKVTPDVIEVIEE